MMEVPETTRSSSGVADLSKVHNALENYLFHPITNGKDWAKFKLTDEQIEQYWKDGYLLNIPVLTHEQCDRINEDVKRLMDDSVRHPGIYMLYKYQVKKSGDSSSVFLHCQGQWRLTKLFHDLVFHPQFLVPASQLINSDQKMKKIRFWHDQLFAKPPRNDKLVGWHQDYSLWTKTKPIMHLTVHIALDDQTEENGALHYIPGSHRWTRDGGPLLVADFDFENMDTIKTVLTEEEKAQFEPVCGNLKKGEISFHHPLVVHGSYGNRSEGPRRAAVINYFEDGVVSDTDGEILKGSLIPKGQKMEGQLYPLVFDPAWME
ncbi:hypothetical protein ACJMK2_025266 [Sinanodonta woodiana]|uniref:Phytanoyl-CoA dioxygenase n=1 Tax=Sinanodonta woodiana TaxID=1069815 RepID=A0ABD3XFY8_SINWO